MKDIIKSLRESRAVKMVPEIWALGWPMTCIMLYEFLIGLSDVYIAGKFGKEAQAAYGFAFQLYFIFILIGIALSVGTVSVVSRLYASDKKADFGSAVNSALILSVVSGLFFGLAGLFFSGDLIRIIGLPGKIKAYAVPFMTIYSLAFFFDYILMNANGILRACGMIRNSLWIMTVVCLLNIVLNFWLALGTPLGFSGVAAATVISLFVGALLSLWYVRRLGTGRSFSFPLIRQILGISWPSGLLQAFWQLGALLLFLIIGALPHNNVEIMAAFTNGLKIESAIFLPAFAFSMAGAVMVGNRLGKGDDTEAFRSGVVTALMGVAVVSVLTILVMLNAGRIAGFLSDNPVVIDQCKIYIYIALISEPLMAWGVILGGGLNGAGDTMSVMLATSLTVWLIRLPLAYIIGIRTGCGAVAIWWAMNLSVLMQAVFITWRYFNKRWIVAARALSD